MFKTFGTSKEVFVNQDEGMFVALPITLDVNVHTLETETEGSKTYVKAGSVVKEGTVVRGITPERYDITEGTANARVAVEGYCWASRLTASALSAAASLPRIVVMPYKSVVVNIVEVDGDTHSVIIGIEGAKFASTVAAANFTISGLTLASDGGVVLNADGTVKLKFTSAGTGSITAIASEAFTGATGSTLKGLPIALEV